MKQLGYSHLLGAALAFTPLAFVNGTEYIGLIAVAIVICGGFHLYLLFEETD